MELTHHRYRTVGRNRVFYRESGDPAAPTVVLLHGAPASSHMYRDLIPLLARRHHVMAPDYIGFGNSDSPTVTEFDYSFDALTAVTDALLDDLGVDTFAMYVQDYGAPVGWRLALAHPDRVTAIITQNGNAYDEGFGTVFWPDLWAYAARPDADTEKPLRAALTEESIRLQYLTGAADPTLVSPDTWRSDAANLQRPGNTEVALALFRDYVTNVALYPAVHEYFRATQVPTLVVWGANDPIFVPEGARAFLRDLPGAELHLLDGGHFLLETHVHAVADLVNEFLARPLGAGS